MIIYIERHIKIDVPELDEICFKSKNLYNKTNKVIGDSFIGMIINRGHAYCPVRVDPLQSFILEI